MPFPSRSALLAAVAALCLAAPAAAQAVPSDAALATFAPYATPNNDQIDYSIWDEAMKNLVVSMGPSLRESAPRPEPSMGTRRQYGHSSRYRLEGTRVMFSFLDAEIIASFTEYRQDLENTASIVDIQALSRNEQLAYWINLHNVALVEQIAKAWPVRQPRDIMVDGVPLDEARFITVEGIKLSPRDIREKIVYRHWKDPAVIYGFWRGEIGGPALQREAFNGRDVGDQLERAAREFANSRRGVERRGSTLHVSLFYGEAAPFFFPEFESDLRAHLGKYVEGKVAEMLAESEVVKASLYEHDIADLSGGRRGNPYFAEGRLDPGAARLLAERRRKLEYVERKLPRTGTVTFSNIVLPGDPPDKGEVE